ncbi:uncharacterized protein LOC100833306 [Brachypodium distachyon]|uniref:Uncharacterized protein n=1 Tax=Brachypodium distachyon TaxID=15368 RepID=I1IPT4_BRADI|nr:uncharacterized protein LOC100833306 [Brachypodium distachyon]PNT64493.1 hypothetical protein BRADI_4g29285v3 [Brachypodium distachyon]|eukprot:XP_003576478.2 uncharacterized protein LOC100833306 [Brachypodium distachyon]
MQSNLTRSPSTTATTTTRKAPAISNEKQRGSSGMERFAAMVTGRRAAPAPKPASAAAESEGDKEYLRIQLEEIVIVKDDAYDALAAATAAARAHAHPHPHAHANGQFSSAAASTSMENCAKAAVAAPHGGPPMAAAPPGAWASVGRIVGD